MSRRSNTYARILSAACLISLLATALFPIQGSSTQTVFAAPIAQEASGEDDQCYSLDVVFIIDQSNSMGEGSDRTDPLDERITAVESAIDQLADNALDRCADSIHRIAVISFGTQARVDLKASEINPETANEAKVISERLKGNIEPDTMVFTNPLSAFKAASSIFANDMPDSTVSAKAGLRKKVIIFVTDGVPEGEGVQLLPYMQELTNYIVTAFPFDDTVRNQEKCFDTLRDRYVELSKSPQEEINRCLTTYPVTQEQLDKSFYIFGLFFHSNAAYPSVMSFWQSIVDTHEGSITPLANNRKEVSSTVRGIISDLIGIKLNVVTCGSFAVNPYLKRAVLTFFKSDPELAVTLSYIDAEGVKHTVTSDKSGNAIIGDTGGFEIADHTMDGTNERYVLNAPYPGIWEINATSGQCKGLDAYYDPVEIKPGSYQPNLPAEIPQFEVAPYYDQYNKYFLEYQIKDIDGQILSQADNPQMAINITLNIVSPDGTATPYTMVWNKEENLFRTSEPIKVPLEGTYTINMVGTYMKHSGDVGVTTSNMAEIFNTETTLFSQEGITFNVHNVIPFTLKMNKPTANQLVGSIHETILSGWPLKIKPLQISVSVLDQNGAPMDPKIVFDDPTHPLEAVVVSGTSTSSKVLLEQDPSDPTRYVGTINDATFSGKQTVRVTVVGDYNQHYRPQTEVIETPIIRMDGIFTLPASYYLLLALMILYIIARIIAWRVAKAHQLGGYLLAKENGTVYRVLNLSTGTSVAKFDYVFWQKDPSHSLKFRSLVIRNMGAAKKPKVSMELPPADQQVPVDTITIAPPVVDNDDTKLAFKYVQENGRKGNGVLRGSVDETIGDPEDRISIEYCPDITQVYQYAQSAEDSGQKVNIPATFLLIVSVLGTLALSFVMFF